MKLLTDLFGDSAQREIKKATKLIDSVLAESGLAGLEPVVDEEHQALVWSFSADSAEVFILLSPGGDEDGSGGMLQVRSLVACLPETNVLPLYRKLLELNGEELIGASFGVSGHYVLLYASRNTKDLDKSEVEQMIHTVAMLADVYDDQLVEEFGCRLPADE